MRELRSLESEAILAIPPVAGLAIVRIQALTVVEAIRTEQAGVTVGNV